MASTLVAVLLVTSSATDSNLVYRWPPLPKSSPRLTKPRSYGPQIPDSPRSDTISLSPAPNQDEYQWKRMNQAPSTDARVSQATPYDTPNCTSPPPEDASADQEIKDRDDDLLGYSSRFLATVLCPRERSLCHQRFKLIVDDLAFIGHPVCAEHDGVWRFKPEKRRHNLRGRGPRQREHDKDYAPATEASSPTATEYSNAGNLSQSRCTWLQTFHLVLVLDRPDPSSSASGNVAKYFETIYEQIVFTVTAVLFQEQVLSNFVEAECEALGALKDQCVREGTPFLEFMSQALKSATLPMAMKTLYEAIKSSSIAYLTINSLPIEVQLPPFLDFLLYPGEDENQRPYDDDNHADDEGTWTREMSVGWRLPSMAPWKSLLLLDAPGNGNSGAADTEMINSLRGAQICPEDEKIAEGLFRFLEAASVTLSLADMASLLDWDLETQVFPTVQWLIHHRRAKIVDVVHSELKTVFALAPKFDQPLSALSVAFRAAFPSPTIPPLLVLLSAISNAFSSSDSAANQPTNTFFASVVRSKDLIPAYTNVVLWLLKRDMLVTLHLRVRIVVTQEIKARVRLQTAMEKREKREKRDLKKDRSITEKNVQDSPASKEREPTWLNLSPKSARRHVRRGMRRESLDIRELGGEDGSILDDKYADWEEQDDLEHDEDEEMRDPYDSTWPTLICDPARATPLQRRWLAAMSEGKTPTIARRFEQINQYFDGRKTDDEILYRAEITRKQLREVLHHYEEYLLTFLHPS